MQFGDEPEIRDYAPPRPRGDLVAGIQRELQRRVVELRPVVQEYQRLEMAAEQLAEEAEGSERSRHAPAPPTDLSSRRHRAVPGATRVAIREALEGGAHTAAELTTLTGMSRTNVNYNLRRLLLRGLIVASERGEETTYRLASRNQLKAV